MSQIKIVDINDKKYIIEPFKGRKGFKLKTKLMRVISPALNEMRKAADEDVSELGLIVTAIQSVLENSEDDEIFSIVEELMTGVKTESGSLDFDLEFSQNYSTLYKLIKEVVEVNYNDVFSLLGMNVG